MTEGTEVPLTLFDEVLSHEVGNCSIKSTMKTGQERYEGTKAPPPLEERLCPEDRAPVAEQAQDLKWNK